MTDFKQNDNKLLNDLQIIKENITPTLIKNLNDNNIDKKSAIIFFVNIIFQLLDDIDNEDFTKLICKYFEEKV